MSVDPPNLALPSLSGYEFRRPIGRGAAGVVWEAWDPELDRRAAIKIVQLAGKTDQEREELRARFRQEAQLTARLAHPGIVGVYGYVGAGDEAFLIMEFVDGGTVRALLDRGERLSVERVVAILSSALMTLDHCHRQGVVHRDIKPSNLMLTTAGAVKVADFGAARPEVSDLTSDGTIIGTMPYLSPEGYIAQRPADARSDVWSCGVVLYELLTGTRPFRGDLAAVMGQVLNVTPPPPSSLVPALPAGFDAVVARALEKDPDKRFQSAGAFAAALVAVLQPARTPTMPMAAPAPEARAVGKRSAWPAIAAGLVVMFAAAGGGAWWFLNQPPAAPTPTPVASPASPTPSPTPPIATPAPPVPAPAPLAILPPPSAIASENPKPPAEPPGNPLPEQSAAPVPLPAPLPAATPPPTPPASPPVREAALPPLPRTAPPRDFDQLLANGQNHANRGEVTAARRAYELAITAATTPKDTARVEEMLDLLDITNPPPLPGPPNQTAKPGQPGWSADPRNGCRIWNQVPANGQTLSWSGPCRDGIAEGTGQLQWRQSGGSVTYNGTVRNGLRHGKGTLVFSDGIRFEARFADGRPEGHSAITAKDGTVVKAIARDGCVYMDGDFLMVLGREKESCGARLRG